MDPRFTDLCRQYSIDTAHADHVAAQAHWLFDKLTHLHGLTKTCRPLLATAAQLHDIAAAEGKADHHVRGHDRLMNIDIPGLDTTARTIVAQAVLLHSSRSDTQNFLARHGNGASLVSRQIAARLAALLRIADGLDHDRCQDSHLHCIHDTGRQIILYINDSPGADENSTTALQKADLWHTLAIRDIHAITTGTDAADYPLMFPDDPVTRAATRLFQQQIEHLASRMYGLGYTADPEFVHEMRVATRRLRAVLKALKDHLPPELVDARNHLAGLARSLGGIRDTDVFIEFLADRAAVMDDDMSHRVHNYIRTMIRRRTCLCRTMLQESSSQGLSDTIHSFWRMVVELPDHDESIRPGTEADDTTAAQQARAQLTRVCKRLYRYRGNLKKMSTTRQHTLRIDCKRMRYLGEFFEDLYEPATMKKILNAPRTMQDHLGTVRDCQAYAGYIRECAATTTILDTRTRDELLRYVRTTARQSTKKAANCWQKFHTPSQRKRMLRLISRTRCIA